MSLYPEIVWQPGEVKKDGVIMTCDGITPEGWVIEEFKFTSKKVRSGQDFLDEWLWQQQARGYAAGYGAVRVRHHVCYDYAGDWRRGSRRPVYMRYVTEYTEEEIEKTWRMVLNHKDGAAPE